MSAYAGPPISAFQGQIRGSSTLLRDHISKEMNELNLERCRCIPKLTPGADWRVLQEIIQQHPERTLYKVRCTATHRFYAWCPLLACFAETTYSAAACRLDIPDLIGMIPQNDALSCSHINGTYVGCSSGRLAEPLFEGHAWYHTAHSCRNNAQVRGVIVKERSVQTAQGHEGMQKCCAGALQGQPLVPWCLPNTADRHNGWRGLFGRLDYDGHFPTSVTDPQPMGKVKPVLIPLLDKPSALSVPLTRETCPSMTLMLQELQLVSRTVLQEQAVSPQSVY